MSARIATAAALIVVALVVGVTIRENSFIPWGTDSGAYLNAAQRWAAHDVFSPAMFVFRYPWAADGLAESPYGHRPGPTKGTFTSSYPLGYPLLLAAALKLGGALAPYLVAPLCAGLLTWCAFLLGRTASTPWAGAMAAVLVAATPVTVVHAIMPMSDVPATAFWALSWVMSLRPGLGAATAAGLCSAMAMMIRPNLAPLALIMAIGTAVSQGMTPPLILRRGVTFAATAAIGPAMVMWSQAVLYGGPFVTGYVAADTFFSADRIPDNARMYPTLLNRLHSWLPLIGLLAPLAVALRGRRDRAAAIVLVAGLGIVVINYVLYLPYLSFFNWGSLRFMLPGLLALFVLFAAVLDWARLWIALRWRWAGFAAIAPMVWVVLSGQNQMLISVREARNHIRLQLMGHYLREALPRGAVILTNVHGGAIALYTGRPIVRLDHVNAEALDGIVADLRRGGQRPGFVLDFTYEHAPLAERFRRSTNMKLDWLPRAEFAQFWSVLYYDVGDREAFLSGDRWPVDIVKADTTPHESPWADLRAPNERIVLPALDETWAFKAALEATYREVLRRPRAPGRLDGKESVRWTRRYLWYRVHGCTHRDAVEKVIGRLHGGDAQPLCGRPTRVVFPARDETVDFRRQLEMSYPESRSAPPMSFVDLEGDAVWLQEYLERRAASCTHDEAIARVTAQIAGQPRTPVCGTR